MRCDQLTGFNNNYLVVARFGQEAYDRSLLFHIDVEVEGVRWSKAYGSESNDVKVGGAGAALVTALRNDGKLYFHRILKGERQYTSTKVYNNYPNNLNFTLQATALGGRITTLQSRPGLGDHLAFLNPFGTESLFCDIQIGSPAAVLREDIPLKTSNLSPQSQRAWAGINYVEATRLDTSYGVIVKHICFPPSVPPTPAPFSPSAATNSPTPAPTNPSRSPTTGTPTAPSQDPTSAPTNPPTGTPTDSPTDAPTGNTNSPTDLPTNPPTSITTDPTMGPTPLTVSPTTRPSASPISQPPTSLPTIPFRKKKQGTDIALIIALSIGIPIGTVAICILICVLVLHYLEKRHSLLGQRMMKNQIRAAQKKMGQGQTEQANTSMPEGEIIEVGTISSLQL